MHVWYVDAGIEDTPEPVYTHCLVLSCLTTTPRLSSKSCLDVLGTHSTNKILRLRSPICRTWTAPLDNSMLVYIMSGYPPVDYSSVSNNLRTIFESLSYGPAPEADDVAQVVVSFNCHCQFA